MAKWKLDHLFVNQDMAKLSCELSLRLKAVQFSSFKKSVEEYNQLATEVEEIGAYAHCRYAQNTEDQEAKSLQKLSSDLRAQFIDYSNRFDAYLASFDDASFEKELEQVEEKFPLRLKRRQVRDKLDEKSEKVIATLLSDGCFAWEQLYRDLTASLDIEHDGKKLSAAQAENMLASSDRKVREQVFSSWVKACQKKEDFFAHELNHMLGFRLGVYDLRKWDLHHEAHEVARLEKKSLDAMWTAVRRKSDSFLQFLDYKAKKLGQDKLSWIDLAAPLSHEEKNYTLDEARKIIEESFATVSSSMQNLVKIAFEKEWVEAEDRGAKAAGAFCISLPKEKESRVFMTFKGTQDNIATLAHELGHAYHGFVLKEGTSLTKDYPMTLAECASTLAELVLSEKMLEKCTEEEKEGILAEKAERSCAFFLNIYARYLFESRVYALRREKHLTSSDFSKIMLDAQKEAYGDRLAEYHPLFWITKQHFHFADIPFYNFPYTVGYLLSMRLIALFKEDRAGFGAKYDAFLKDTGIMSVEEIVKKHFKEDASSPSFWEKALDVAQEDVRRLIK